jgi:purine-binding chemotaxis protein CheW
MSGGGRETQFVTLGLGKEVFAVPVEYVREILDYREPFAIPEGPAWFLGLTDVRGQATPTIDLRRRLGLPSIPPDLGTRILVLDVPLDASLGQRTLSLGLVADRVIEVVSVAHERIEPAPEIGVPWRSDYIRGVVRRDAGFVVIFDLPQLLSGVELAALPGSSLEPAA